MVTPARRLFDLAAAQNPNVVKVVMNQRGRALYFSRSPLPYWRDGERPYFYKHIGIYAYRVDFLRDFVTLFPGRWERPKSWSSSGPWNTATPSTWWKPRRTPWRWTPRRMWPGWRPISGKEPKLLHFLARSAPSPRHELYFPKMEPKDGISFWPWMWRIRRKLSDPGALLRHEVGSCSRWAGSSSWQKAPDFYQIWLLT
jgi:hypothetical protein